MVGVGADVNLTTTVGKGKAEIAPPPDNPFPFPYHDDFEAPALTRSARYLADQDGAFETQACEHRQGQCLAQVITREPIVWGAAPLRVIGTRME